MKSFHKELWLDISSRMEFINITHDVEETINETILIKYTDPQEHELVKARCNETFGVSLA